MPNLEVFSRIERIYYLYMLLFHILLKCTNSVYFRKRAILEAFYLFN